MFFAAALEERPHPGGLVRPYGTWYEPYVPYYYLGLAQHHLGRDTEALASWERSEEAGVIRYPRNRRKWQELVRLREESRSRLRDRGEALHDQAAGAAEALARLRPGVAEADYGIRLEGLQRQLNLVQQELATRSRANVQALARAAHLVHEAESAIDEILSRREAEAAEARVEEAREEERQRKARWTDRWLGAAEAIEADDCAPEAVSELRALVEDAEVREGFESFGAVELALAAGVVGCGDPALAGLYLDLARDSDTARAAIDLQQRIGAAAEERDLLRAYQEAWELVAAGGCQPRGIRLLEAVSGYWWSAAPEPEGVVWRPHALLAEAYLACGFAALALEEVEVAAIYREPPDAIASVEARLAGSASAGDPRSERRMLAALLAAAERGRSGGLDAEEEERRLEDSGRSRAFALADLLRARALVDLGDCDEEAFTALGGAASLPQGWSGRDVLVLQARAARVCGDEGTLGRLVGELRGSSDPVVEELRRWHESIPTVGGVYDGSHALLIIASYDEPDSHWQSLSGTRTDLRIVERALRHQGFDVETVRDPRTTELAQRIKSFVTQRGQGRDDRLVLYFAGHGWTYTNPVHGLQQGFFVPAGARHPEREKDAMIELLSMEEIGSFVQLSESRDVLVVFDSCFGGAIMAAASALPDRSSPGGPAVEVIRKPSRVFMTAGRERETVPDFSLFRRAFHEGLQGRADVEVGGDGDGLVLGRELSAYVRETMMGRAGTRPLTGKLVPDTARGGDLAVGDIAFVSFSSESVERPGAVRAELELWQAALQRGGHESFEAFLRAYPDGRLAPAARLLAAAGAPVTPSP